MLDQQWFQRVTWNNGLIESAGSQQRLSVFQLIDDGHLMAGGAQLT
jgi:hypothetical protein